MDKYRERFAASFEVNPSTGCWEWTRPLNGNGYGSLYIGGKRPMGAHRAAWELMRGPVPVGMQVCHRCDNRRCVNPGHLFLGTQSDNLRDCVGKGRFNPPRGERSGRAILTDDEVRSIRSEHAGGARTCDIAKRHGIIFETARKVVRRLRWNHI